MTRTLLVRLFRDGGSSSDCIESLTAGAVDPFGFTFFIP